MTNYNDGKWHGWNGGECPVHPESVVECVTLPTGYAKGKAKQADWDYNPDPIIAFRVVEEHKEPVGPREFWIGRDCFLGYPDIKNKPTEGYIHVREVL